MRLQSTGSCSLHFISSSSQESGHMQLSASRDNLQMRTLHEESVKQAINNVRCIMSYTSSSQCSPIFSCNNRQKNHHNGLHQTLTSSRFCFQKSLSYYWSSIVNTSEFLRNKLKHHHKLGPTDKKISEY